MPSVFLPQAKACSLLALSRRVGARPIPTPDLRGFIEH